MEDKKTRNIPEYIKQYFNEPTQFNGYYEYEKNIRERRNVENQFLCLKGFSSSTPIVNSATTGREIYGGGFYFRYRGHGIVVDPGIGFVTQMHRNKVFIDDVDTVIVTHAHLDHNCEVGSIASLLYDYNKNRNKDIDFFSYFFGCKLKEKHSITWFMDQETIDAYKTQLGDDQVHNLEECCGDSPYSTPASRLKRV